MLSKAVTTCKGRGMSGHRAPGMYVGRGPCLTDTDDKSISFREGVPHVTHHRQSQVVQ